MGGSLSRARSDNSSVRIRHAGGYVEEYSRPVSAQQVMLHYPRHWLTRPEVFQSNVESRVIPPERVLMLGETFLLVPIRTIFRLMEKDGSSSHAFYSLMMRQGCTTRSFEAETRQKSSKRGSSSSSRNKNFVSSRSRKVYSDSNLPSPRTESYAKPPASVKRVEEPSQPARIQPATKALTIVQQTSNSGDPKLCESMDKPEYHHEATNSHGGRRYCFELATKPDHIAGNGTASSSFIIPFFEKQKDLTEPLLKSQFTQATMNDTAMEEASSEEARKQSRPSLLELLVRSPFRKPSTNHKAADNDCHDPIQLQHGPRNDYVNLHASGDLGNKSTGNNATVSADSSIIDAQSALLLGKLIRRRLAAAKCTGHRGWEPSLQPVFEESL